MKLLRLLKVQEKLEAIEDKSFLQSLDNGVRKMG
jgi:hypothetical protein